MEVNKELVDNPAIINKDPLGAGWMVKLQIDDPTQLNSLMDEAAYKEHCEHEDH